MDEVNILVIEDNPEQAKLIEETLKSEGYRVWLVSEPKEGFELMKNINFAVVITELRSGKMNGIEVTEHVRKVSPDTNVIVITFYSFINSAIEAMEAGAYGYITKPLNSSEIRIVVYYAIERFVLLSSDHKKEYFARLAIVDSLTGLYNRRYFMELINIEFNRLKRRISHLSLIMIDIDNFKNYNDTYGHPAGDELLRKTATLFKECIREIDVVCRYGGEEFCVVLPDTDKRGAEVVAARLVGKAGLFLPTTISAGVATYPEDATEIEGLIDKADSALYRAKQLGKNRFCLAS